MLGTLSEYHDMDLDKLDRLDKAFAISLCSHALKTSMDGWLQWASGYVYRKFSPEDLDKIFRIFLTSTEALLALDVEITTKYYPRGDDETVVTKPPPPPRAGPIQ